MAKVWRPQVDTITVKSLKQLTKTYSDNHDDIGMKTNYPVQSDFDEVKATVAVNGCR